MRTAPLSLSTLLVFLLSCTGERATDDVPPKTIQIRIQQCLQNVSRTVTVMLGKFVKTKSVSMVTEIMHLRRHNPLSKT